MADFRIKLFTLASVATMFAGMAHAQLNQVACTAAAGANFIAAESTTEQVADTTITCAASGNAAATTVNLSVYLSPAVTITSATVGSGGGARNETMAGVGAAGAPFATTVGVAFGGGVTTLAPVNGTVSGSSVTFNGIQIANNAVTTFTITNIKVNASQVATGAGAPTAISETIFIGGTNVTPGVLPAVNVAFVTNGLAGIKATQSSGNSIKSIQICAGVNAYGGPLSQDAKLTVGGVTGAVGNLDGNAAFNVQFSEGFANAFKDKGTAAGNNNLGSEFGTNNTYTGYGVAAGGGTNTATSGTRVQAVFNNIPAGVTVYVPLTILESSGAAGLGGATKMVLVTSATGAQNLATGSTANGAPGATGGFNGGDSSAAALTVSNGSATAVYEEVNNSTGVVETYQVPVMLAAGGAAVTAPSSAITATVSFAPIGSSSSVPNYVSGSSTATVNGAAFSACTTTLLFPFVTNQLGFDTGIAIANTSTDILKDNVSKSQAAPQSGTCQLSFFGNTAPAAVTTPNVASGTDYAAAASTVAPGFQGYMIANCNFLYAHGFAYVVYNLTQNNGAAMGYLANVIEANRNSVVAEQGGVNTNNPEASGQ